MICYCYLSSDINHWLFKIWNSLCMRLFHVFDCAFNHWNGLWNGIKLLSFVYLVSTLYTQHSWYYTTCDLWMFYQCPVWSTSLYCSVGSWQKWCNKQWKYIYMYTVHYMCWPTWVHKEEIEFSFQISVVQTEWYYFCWAVFEHFGPLQHMLCLNWACKFYTKAVFHVLKNSLQIL